MTPTEAPPSEAQAPPRVAHILVIDDEAPFARAVARRLEKEGHRCSVAGTLEAGQEALAADPPDLVLLDVRLPDGDGIDFLVRHADRGGLDTAPVIVLTAWGALPDAVQAVKIGATDYLKKPLDLQELVLAVERALETDRLRHRLDCSRERDAHLIEDTLLLGESAPLAAVRDQVRRLASLTARPGEALPTVLILGETGTGKDVVARMLHRAGPLPERPFVQVDCASLPRDLIEAELFGHEKGAFTSAVGSRAGLIEAAEDGTLFLDEIGELSMDLQAKLLNVIERRRLRRLGSTREREVAARFVAATNRDLPELIRQERFRPDLYYRLNVVTIFLPPLRERGDDILMLAQHYARLTARRYALPEPQLNPEAVGAMRRYPWPGNVRELKHLVERAVLLCRSGHIRPADLALDSRLAADRSAPAIQGMSLEEAERYLIVEALNQTGQNVSEAARRLGVSRMALRYRMEKHRLRESTA